MYLKYCVLYICILFISSCSSYVGDYKETYFYKYNDIKNIGSYSLVFNDSVDSYSNFKYLQISEKIKDNLNLLGFFEAKDPQKSDYIVYYDYSVINKNNIYNVVLSIKIFDTKNMVNVFNESSATISKRNQIVFDASSVLYTSKYLPNQNISCLLNSIFKNQIMSETKTINIKSKISKEELSISNKEGVYYCLN